MKQRHHPRIGILKQLNWSGTETTDTPLGVILARTAPITTDKDQMFEHWKTNRVYLKKAGYRLHLRGKLWFITQHTVPKQDVNDLRKLMNQYLKTRTWFPTPKHQVGSIPHEHEPAFFTAWEALKPELQAEGINVIRIDRDKWSITAPAEKPRPTRRRTTSAQEHSYA